MLETIIENPQAGCLAFACVGSLFVAWRCRRLELRFGQVKRLLSKRTRQAIRLIELCRKTLKENHQLKRENADWERDYELLARAYDDLAGARLEGSPATILLPVDDLEQKIEKAVLN